MIFAEYEVLVPVEPQDAVGTDSDFTDPPSFHTDCSNLMATESAYEGSDTGSEVPSVEDLQDGDSWFPEADAQPAYWQID